MLTKIQKVSRRTVIAHVYNCHHLCRAEIVDAECLPKGSLSFRLCSASGTFGVSQSDPSQV